MWIAESHKPLSLWMQVVPKAGFEELSYTKTHFLKWSIVYLVKLKVDWDGVNLCTDHGLEGGRQKFQSPPYTNLFQNKFLHSWNQTVVQQN